MTKLLAYALILSLTACSYGDPNEEAHKQYDAIFSSEASADSIYRAAPVILQGTVLDTNNNPINGASVSIMNMVTTSDNNGKFLFENLKRINSLIVISKDGYYKEVRPTHLQVSLEQNLINFGVVYLKTNENNNSRLLFAGDTSFGRRLLDPTGTTPFDQMPVSSPLAAIDVNNPLEGSINVLKHMKSTFENSDFQVINFESPVITDPSITHPTKDYSFFTLPGSLDALHWLGIDYISLGNNHVYDYLEPGIVQTLNYINEAGLPNSGAGKNTEEAFIPYETKIKSTDFSFISVNTISGDKHDINYVAEDNKGGAADGRLHNKLEETIKFAIKKNQQPIVQYHTGDEYSYKPSSFAHKNMTRAIDLGASMVISHHPHIAQGFEWYNGKFIAHSLGNFLLDQQRLETMLGVMTEVDVDSQGDVKNATAIPIYLEDYSPHLIAGKLNNHIIHRMNEKSINLIMFEQGGRATILQPEETPILERRTISIKVTISDKGHETIDLRNYLKNGEYLSQFPTTSNRVQLGRDIMKHGDFEDYDLDSDRFELKRWDVSSEDRLSCRSGSYKGANGACLVRKDYNKSSTVMAFRNSIRVIGDALDTPNKDLTFLTYVKGKNSGPINIYSRYTSSKDANFYGEEVLFSKNGGTFDWMKITTDMNMPKDESSEKKNPSINARATRVFVRHSPPSQGAGILMVDEMAVISWEPSDLGSEVISNTLKGPHPLDFLKIHGEPGEYNYNIEISKIVEKK